MSTILQNLGHECFEARYNVNLTMIHLDNIDIGQVVPSAGIFDIALKNITVEGIQFYSVKRRDAEGTVERFSKQLMVFLNY